MVGAQLAPLTTENPGSNPAISNFKVHLFAVTVEKTKIENQSPGMACLKDNYLLPIFSLCICNENSLHCCTVQTFTRCLLLLMILLAALKSEKDFLIVSVKSAGNISWPLIVNIFGLFKYEKEFTAGQIVVINKLDKMGSAKIRDNLCKD